MRRFGWQVGGLMTAVASVVALAVFVFAGATPARVALSHGARPTPRPTPPADPRVAAVEAAARAYVEALDNAMRTGSPDELDSLSVPGSQAEGNAGIAAHVVRDTSRTFIVTQVAFTSVAVDIVASSDATAQIDYQLTGYDAAWPSLKALGGSRTVERRKLLEFTLLDGRWLVASAQ